MIFNALITNNKQFITFCSKEHYVIYTYVIYIYRKIDSFFRIVTYSLIFTYHV